MRSGTKFAAACFAFWVVVAFVDARLTLALLDVPAIPIGFEVPGWLSHLSRFDSGWYHLIAADGYFFDGPGRQSSVAFFPAYPGAMRVVGTVLGGHLALAGIVVTVASGLGLTVMFHRWVEAFLGTRTARLAVAVLLTYPFAFYFFGVIYSEAFFVACALGAFVLLEKDRPVLAGIVGAAATAGRPVGIAVFLGLAVRTLEIRGVFFARRPPALTGDGERPAATGLRPRDAGVLLSILGLLGFMALLWVRFGHPIAFVEVNSAPGWERVVNVETVAKLHFFRLLGSYGLNLVTFWLIVQGIYSLLALGLVPAVVRRFGWGYGTYLLATVGIAFVAARDFQGMGRFVLTGFPAFAAGADLLARRIDPIRVGKGLATTLTGTLLVVEGGLLLWMISLFTRWRFLS